MNTEIETLGDALPKEIDRCEKLMEVYRQLGPVGSFGLAVIRFEVEYAKKVTREGDTVGMIVAYEKLKECK